MKIKIKNEKKAKRVRRHRKIRARLSGTEARPRLAVFRSNRYVYAQLINDDTQKTLLSASSKELKGKSALEKAKEVGRLIAKKAGEQKIKNVVFDRAGFVFTGKIKAGAEGSREAGLAF